MKSDQIEAANAMRRQEAGGDSLEDRRFSRFVNTIAQALGLKDELDGDQAKDGYSLHMAAHFFAQGLTAGTAIAEFLMLMAGAKKITESCRALAQQHLGIEHLETRGRDSLDFHDLSVARIEAALKAAYAAGAASAAGKA